MAEIGKITVKIDNSALIQFLNVLIKDICKIGVDGKNTVMVDGELYIKQSALLDVLENHRGSAK